MIIANKFISELNNPLDDDPNDVEAEAPAPPPGLNGFSKPPPGGPLNYNPPGPIGGGANPTPRPTLVGRIKRIFRRLFG